MNGKVIGALIVILLAVVMLFNSCAVVQPGNRGVRITLGSVSNGTLDEGIHFKMPFIQKVVPMLVKVQKADVQAPAVSRDLQDIQTHIIINYHLIPERVSKVYKEYAKSPQEANDIIINPKVQETVKAIISKYNTLELVSQREEISSQIKSELKQTVLRYDIVLDELSIANFEFSPAFKESIERKQVAEQDAITAQKKLEQVKFEAEQLIAQAKGEAESNRLKQITLTPMLIEWEKVQKWDGVLPTVVGGSGGMFLNVGAGK